MTHTGNPDVLVIGAGLIGSSVAWRLAQAGLRVTVVDRAGLGAEASSAAAGMIAPQGERLTPEPFSRLCWESHRAYPEFIAEVEALARCRTGYRRDGSLLVAIDSAQAAELGEIERDSEAAVARGEGRPVERLSAETLRKRVPGIGPGLLGALYLPADHWVDNEKLTAAVVEAAQCAGVVFRASCPVERLVVERGRMTAVEAEGERLEAGEFVLAAGCWSGALAAPLGLHVPTVPCRGQMIEFEGFFDLPMVVRAGHHYLVPRADGKVLAGTTAEYVGYEKKVTVDGMASILRAVVELAPGVAKAHFHRAWAGLRPDTADHLPLLGRSGIPGLTLATGHFRNGILLAPVTAKLITDLLGKGSAPELEGFGPERFAVAIRGAKE